MTTFYRHSIHEFSFIALDGKEKWIAYKFTKNVYDYYSLKLYKLICSGIDNLLAGINFDLSESASFSQPTLQSSQQSNTESMLGEDNGELNFLDLQEITPITSFASKKPRNQRAVGQ